MYLKPIMMTVISVYYKVLFLVILILYYFYKVWLKLKSIKLYLKSDIIAVISLVDIVALYVKYFSSEIRDNN